MEWCDYSEDTDVIVGTGDITRVKFGAECVWCVQSFN